MRLFPVALAVCLLAGCRTLPNTQPFLDATGGLRSAVASVGSAVTAELKATPLLSSSGAEFERAWRVRNNAMGALVSYASSLQAIVDSGKKGEESAQQLTDAVGKLADAAGLAVPGAAEAVGLAADTFKAAYGQIAKARAAKSLERSLAELQPVIELIARKLAADLKAADGMLDGAIEQELTNLAREPGNGSSDDYRRALLTTMGKFEGATRLELTKAPPITPEQRKLFDDLAEISKRIDQLEEGARYKSYQAQRVEITRRGRIAHEAIAETQSAIEGWAALHAQMLAVVQTRRAPTPGELLEGIGRVRGLVDRYRALTAAPPPAKSEPAPSSP